ncbi:MAG: hypothetical protein R3F60_02080 [bacterium]
MRILLVIVTVLGSLVAVGLGGLTSYARLVRDADDMAQIEKSIEGQAGMEPVKAMVEGFRRAGIGGLLVALACLALLILTLARSTTPATLFALVAIGAGVAFIVLCPDLETMGADELPPRTQAMLYGIPAAIAGLAGLGAARLGRG